LLPICLDGIEWQIICSGSNNNNLISIIVLSMDDEKGLKKKYKERSKSQKKPQTTKKAGKDDKEIKELKQKIDELNDKYIRLFSEYDNYRKRTLKEKIELSKTASGEVITAILPVLDDFERAIKSFGEMKVDENFKEGVVLIFNKFLTVLSQKGLEQMKTIGESFDTEYHDAVTSIPAPSKDMIGKIVDEIEKGYLLNGKVIRYAKVVIGS
jgi:molecular chaperone GrpE